MSLQVFCFTFLGNCRPCPRRLSYPPRWTTRPCTKVASAQFHTWRASTLRTSTYHLSCTVTTRSTRCSRARYPLPSPKCLPFILLEGRNTMTLNPPNGNCTFLCRIPYSCGRISVKNLNEPSGGWLLLWLRTSFRSIMSARKMTTFFRLRTASMHRLLPSQNLQTTKEPEPFWLCKSARVMQR